MSTYRFLRSEERLFVCVTAFMSVMFTLYIMICVILIGSRKTYQLNDSRTRLQTYNTTINMIETWQWIAARYRQGYENTWCFDYDDTLFFTSLVFEYHKKNRTNNDRKTLVNNKSADNRSITTVVHQQPSPVSVWETVNDYNLSKQLQVRKNKIFWLLDNMIYLDKAEIVVLTGRCPSSDERKLLDAFTLARLLLEELEDYDALLRPIHIHLSERSRWLIVTRHSSFWLRVVMVCSMNKSKIINEYRCDRMFGDSDDDISSCLTANNHCIPMRILRSSRSTYNGAYTVGRYFETVITDTST